MNKTKKTFLTVIAVALISLTAGAQTNADNHESLSCSEINQYFNAIRPEVPAGTGTECTPGHHDSFPGTHIADIDPSSHQPANLTNHQPQSEHRHNYINMTQEDLDRTDGNNYYFRSLVDSFEIKLHGNFLETIDLDTIECSGLAEDNNCEGETAPTDDFSDGRHYQVSFDRTRGILKWKFLDDLPKIPGINSTLDELREEAGRTNDELNRMVSEAITFKTTEQEEEFWSATTTARIRIKDQYTKVAKDAEEAPAPLEWKDSDPNGDFYWFNIGTATTVWKKDIPACKILQVNHPEDIFMGRLSRFQALATDSEGNEMESKIKFSVPDHSYGTFYTSRQEFPLNLSEMVCEFSAFPLCLEPGSALDSTLDLIRNMFLRDELSLVDFSMASVANAAELFSAGGKTADVDPRTTVYFFAERTGEGVINVSGGATCERTFDIAERNACVNLDLTSNPASPLIIGQSAELALDNAIDINGDPLPPSTKIVWSSNTLGKFSYGDQTGSTLTLTLADTPVTINDIILPGKISAQIQPNDPAFSQKCKPNIPVELPLACRDLRLQVNKNSTNETITLLRPNEMYKVQGHPTYTRPHTGTIDYSVDENFGSFVNISSTSIFNPNIIKITLLQQAERLSRTTLVEAIGADKVSSATTLPQEKKAILATYSNIETDSDNALSAAATGFNCSKSMEFKGVKEEVPPPPEEELQCLYLEIIQPDRDAWYLDDNNSETIEVRATTDPAGRQSELHYNWQVSDGGNWQGNGTFIEAKKGATTQVLEDFGEDTFVEVWTEENKASACYDSIKPTIPEKPGEPEEEVPPSIIKFVYPENRINDADDDIINISDRTDFVTYAIVYTTGNYKSASITETDLDNGRIQAIGNLGGYLDFEAMKINILEEGETLPTNILKTTSFQDDIQERRIPAGSTDYQCNDASDDICFEGEAEDVVKDFRNGRAIHFNNTHKLGENGKIIIKYQLKNVSAIDEEECKKLSAENGCGEELRNRAKVTAYKETGYSGKEYEDGDSAKVIVICPFILTRSGGDVFFYDAIDTGIDVAKCSPVKGSTGTGVTPKKPDKPGVPKTGAGDLPEGITFLDLPSHDVCRYSNIAENIEGYNDVLENFSSTICELKAEIAAEWQEENIVKSIAANITRIARFGENLYSVSNLENIINLSTVYNKQSGVFIKTGGDLHIGNYIVKGENGIPAAQTFIVRGHDLYIDANIEYGPTDYTKPKSIPSIAFIVMNGDIYIDSDVTEIDGILMAVDLNGDGSDGKIIANGGKTKNRLKINGSLIGNVYDLFKNRIGVGDPTKDEGSVTIFYDERILLNTPPGISELIDLEQAVVPN